MKSTFLFGAATAAHQVEGNNTRCDFWAMEHMEHTTFSEPSLDACDHYNRYEEDIALLAEAGLNAYRFSIEWARIEPEEGEFDDREAEHYRKMIACCRSHGVEPIVTLHHFSSPVWFIRKGGWEAETAPEDFGRYARFVAERLGNGIHYVCTINEANMGIQIAAVAERYLRRMKAMAEKASRAGETAESQVQVGMNLEKMMESRKFAMQENMEAFGTTDPMTFLSPRTPRGDELVMEAHAAARKAIRETAPHVKVGMTLSIHDIQAVPGGETAAEKEWDDEFAHYLPWLQDDDFLGVQNYTRTQYGPDGVLPTPDGAELTQMDYEFYPQALENVLRRVAKFYRNELIVTENGIATADDARRTAFIDAAVAGVERCAADGIPVKGYCYWSLLDNFEWQKGYGMTFGLIAVDRSTQTRTPKESLFELGRLAKLHEDR